jgi:hypothetical protein
MDRLLICYKGRKIVEKIRQTQEIDLASFKARWRKSLKFVKNPRLSQTKFAGNKKGVTFESINSTNSCFQ